jgi:hypothetical protein
MTGMVLITKESYDFLKDSVIQAIDSFVDDPHEVCEGITEVKLYYEKLVELCKDCDMDFWKVVNEDAKGSLIKSTVKFRKLLQEAGVVL